MSSKYSVAFALILLFCVLVKSSFIKPNNVPRVGRSNEADGMFDQGAMGYVIKTIPNKNIPRMGRRNFDSANRFDIPKFYQLPTESFELYEDGDQSKYSQETPLEAAFNNHLENMK
ncbi:PREDICTED: uncharacterized protein LOC106101897 [Papilio polytes]|uniref:uncharacterized protein LOC106101897 n=1 Tax=Papilio polytes TaxID=76194 RepID=UPI000675C9B9|nr:PREDICTED: uncharacterized protein LOC106101897 [Papilio polytes]